MGEGDGRLEGLLEHCEAALAAVDGMVDAAREGVAKRVCEGGRVIAAGLDEHQLAAHGLAWAATYAEALRQMLAWARRLDAGGRLGSLEALLLQAAYGEYLSHLLGGIALSQGETLRPRDYGCPAGAVAAFLETPAVVLLTAEGHTAAVRKAIADAIADGSFGDSALDDHDLALIGAEMRRFVEAEVVPHAQDWHRRDLLIPLSVIEHMAALGVFGVTIAEDYEGLGLGKVAMCVVTEELSRGHLGVGSLGTRTEIAAELIAGAGTAAQKTRWLPALARGEVIPTAVFTEPGAGSDLGNIRTRAERDGDVWRITGNKTWITHAARADLMTLLARTDPETPGWRGLSMFVAEKPRGTEDEPFPVAGMSGTEIPVIGYRGMKEYEIAFDGFAVPAANLLGEVEGQGFKQLMATFEGARIQTAARAVGVAQNALELGLAYARERVQFGRPIYAFPRVSAKLAWAAVEIMIARQLTWFAAREKDSGRRSDLEAGMAKLLAARVAWASADTALQVHGGNGYAEEFPISRVLCDSRILNIFEGAAEIQAHVIARRLLAA